MNRDCVWVFKIKYCTKWVKRRQFTGESQFTQYVIQYIVFKQIIISLKEPVWQWKEDKLQSQNVPDLILPFKIWNENIVHDSESKDSKRFSIQRILNVKQKTKSNGFRFICL